MPETRLPERPLSRADGDREDTVPAGGSVGLPPWLERSRLTATLDAAATCPITLVSAAAGWGKTAMLAEWRRASAGRAAMLWYSGDLDDRCGTDRELWERIITELTAVGAMNGADANATAGPALVVIDDFDELAGPDLLTGIEYLVRAFKGRVRTVVSCRTPPPLPWHRWRVTGELADIRGDQLAFTLDETAGLIAAHGLDVSEAGLAELQGLTEGWPAGLRLAALTMREHAEPEQAIAELGLDDLVADYLNEEVLARMPADTRRLLAYVSVADQVTAGMVDAVTGRDDGARVLADLDQQGAFVHRRSGPAEWYRFHPLLGRLLYARLRRQDPPGVAVAHRRAADWHIAHGPPVEALRHLLAAEDWGTAVETMEQRWPDIAVDSRRRRVDQAVPVPLDALHMKPDLALAFAAERLDAADAVGARRFLRIAGDRDGAPTEVTGSPALLALQLAEARLTGDLDQVVEAAERLLALPSAAGDQERRALGLIALGRANLQLGRHVEAGAQLCEGLSLASQTDLSQDQISAGSHVALWHATGGRLHAAVRTGRETLALAERLGLTRMSDLGWARLALAEAYYQWDRLPEAHRTANEAVEHAYGDPQMLVSIAAVQARIWSAAGRPAEAHEVLLGARQEAAGTRVAGPARRALSLVEAELRLAGGDLVAARRLLSTGLPDDPLPAWTALVEGAILLAEGKAATAATLVAPFLYESDLPSLTWRAQAGLLGALAGRVLHDRARVARGLDIALEAAEQEGFRRMFVAGGHALRELLVTAAPGMSVYRLVASDLARPPHGSAPAIEPRLTGTPTSPGRPWIGSVLVEPLTERELTVLRYLQGDLSNVEIGSVLCISVNTIKTHVKNIYRKLNAVRRREAVQRGRELRLL
jgi:LuxR family maltose regulon positive regulatory protein